MKRKAGSMLLLAALSGCVATEQSGPGSYMSQYNQGPPSPMLPEGAHVGATVVNGSPGLMGPGGAPMAALAPAQTPQLTPESYARQTIAQGLPPGILQQLDKENGRAGPIMQASANMPAGPYGAPPMMAPPGMCGPQGCGPQGFGAGPLPPGAVAAAGALTGCPPSPFPIQRTSVRFVGPSGMNISWYGRTADGKQGFGRDYLVAPGRYNFLQAAIYRLKLTDIPQRPPGLVLYPTLEVVPVNNKTATFLAHSSVPVNITDEDLNQVAAGNFVVKVIYLPDPQFQDLASTGAEEIISSRLEPGADPIAEAVRRGNILLILRLGNILLEETNTPPMDAPGPTAARQQNPGMGGMTGPVPPFGLTGNPRQNMQPGMMPPQNLVPQDLKPQGGLPPNLMPRMGAITQPASS